MSQFRASIRAPAVGKIDELHNLDIRTKVGAEASDQIKYLSERIPATFVLAGVDVEGTGLFTGRRGGQIASRYTEVATRAFPYKKAKDKQAWQSLVTTLEEALRLRAHRPQTLLKLSGYLHDRTAGMIGSLSHLVREAALDAILGGSEKITRTGLDDVELDRAVTRPAGRRSAPAARKAG